MERQYWDTAYATNGIDIMLVAAKVNIATSPRFNMLRLTCQVME
jgi:hypothetical protein